MNSPIPLCLSLSSDDSVAVDLLSNPEAITVRLVRSLTTRDSLAGRGIMGQAVFWPSSTDVPSTVHRGTQQLSGELLVRKRAVPSFEFDKVAVRYDLLLYPFKAPGFASDARADKPLSSEEVKITIQNYHGIVPRSYAPPGVVLEVEEEARPPFVFAPNPNPWDTEG